MKRLKSIIQSIDKWMNYESPNSSELKCTVRYNVADQIGEQAKDKPLDFEDKDEAVIFNQF